jgi:hypothetical protein
LRWQVNVEMAPAGGDGWAELQDDGSLEGEICFANGDGIPFIARRSKLLQKPASLPLVLGTSPKIHPTQ